ncbi:MAG: tetratricopeptide repeat protein [Phycisphaerae bacterium]|jgi:tetratricopeptide (TPR) repeat protein
MARKRVNKNLVAFLTVMGILLTVIVVALATSRGARKDPHFWEAKAVKEREAGDMELAMNYFDRAYRASKPVGGGPMDVSYLVKLAECALQYGDYHGAMGTLERARAEQPQDVEVLETYLRINWDLFPPERGMAPVVRTRMLEYAETLREVDPENVLGPLSVAAARWAMVEHRDDPDSPEWAAGDEAFQEAERLAPDDPRVVRTRIEVARRKAAMRVAQAREEGASAEDIEAIGSEFMAAAVEALKAGIAAHPGDRRLVETYARTLENQGQPAEARQVFEQALTAQEGDPDLQFGLAQLLFRSALRERDTLSAEAFSDLLTQATTHARRAVELERALYEAWTLLGQIELARDYEEHGDSPDITPAAYEASLKVFAEAIDGTVGVRSLHAALGDYQHRVLYGRAFTTALGYALAVTGAERQQRWTWVNRFLDETEVRYRDEAFAHYMRGQAALMQNDLLVAAQSFEKAQARADADTGPYYPRMWFEVFRGELPVDRLALLYRDLRQPGESLRYTEMALREHATPVIQLYRDGAKPPLALMLNRAELLSTLGQTQQARDSAAELRRDYADELASNETVRLRLAAIEAGSLQQEGREGEAREALAPAAAGLGGVSGTLTQAYGARMDGDVPTAIKLYSEALSHPEFRVSQVSPVLRLLVPMLVQAKEQEQGRQILAGVRQRFGSDERIARLLGQYELLLEDLTPEEFEARLRELIQAEPDPVVRTNWWVNYYTERGEWEQVLPYLDQLEKDNPDDSEVLANQFFASLRLERYDRAAQYVALLARLNADNAGGATYRGQLALAQSKPDVAVREFRMARDMLPRTSTMQVWLARALLAAGQLDEAAEALEVAVQLNPLDFNAHKLLYVTYQSMTGSRRPPDGGVSHLLDARKLRPDDPFIRERAEFLDEEDNPRAGIDKREQQRTATPDDVPNLIRLAQLYAKVGDEAQAAERLQEGLRLAPANTDLAVAAAQFYASTGRRQEGEQHLRAYLESQSGKERAYAQVLLGKFYERLGDLGAAEAAYQDGKRVVEADITDPDERRSTLLSVAFELVEFYRRNDGRQEAMIDACRWVLDKLRADDPQDTARRQYARLTIIQGLLSLGRYGDAGTELATYQADYPEDANGLIAMAQLRLSQRELTKAHELLGQVLRVSPNHVWSLLARGRLSVRFGKYAEAREDLLLAREQLKPSSDNPQVVARWLASPDGSLYQKVCTELAGLYEVSGRAELAEAELRQLMDVQRQDPEGGEAVNATVTTLLTLLTRTGQFDKAKNLASEFMNRDQSSAAWPQRFASVCVSEALRSTRLADEAAQAGKRSDEERYRAAARAQYESAVDYFQRAERLAQPQDFGLFMRCLAFRLDAQIAMGQAAQAIQVFEQVLSRTQQVPAIVRASVIRGYVTLKRMDDALAQLEAGMETGAAEAANTLQAVVGFSREYVARDQITASLRKVAERSPADTPAGLRLRNALAAQLLGDGKATEAMEVLKPALASTAGDAADHVATQLLQAQALDETGQVAEAVRVLEGVVRAFPAYATALNNLAYLLADKADRPQEALSYAEAAYEQEPRNANVLDTVGWVYFKNAKYEQAEVTLRQALALDQENVAVNLHLGLLLVDRGRNTEARTILERARAVAARYGDGPYTQQIEDALKRLP